MNEWFRWCEEAASPRREPALEVVHHHRRDEGLAEASRQRDEGVVPHSCRRDLELVAALRGHLGEDPRLD